MSLSAKLRRAPLRIASGAFILNSGVGKLTADDETAKTLHGMASGTYPFLGRVDPTLFARGLAVGEVALGGALLLPVVPAAVAGAALMGFSGALLALYWRTPGLHEEGSPRPTQQGIPLAKDVWMFGIGSALVADGVLEPAHDKKVAVEAAVAEKQALRSRRRARRVARRPERAAQLKGAARQAWEQAGQTSEQVVGRLAEARTTYAPVAAEAAGQLTEVTGQLTDRARSAADELRHRGQQLAADYRDYRPVAGEKASQLRDAARHLAQESRHLAQEYGPIAAEMAGEKADQLRRAAHGVRERVTG